MTTDQLTIILAVLVGLGLPGLGLLWRMSAQWTRVNERLGTVQKQLDLHIVEDKDERKVFYAAMRDDRKATNDRLTWLERRT